MKTFLVSLVLLLTACSSSWPPPRAPEAAPIEVSAALRIEARCDLSPTAVTTVLGFGSAIAVAPRYALTARHNLIKASETAARECGGADMFVLMAITTEGYRYEVVGDAIPGDPDWENHVTADQARLVLAGTAEFRHYAPLATRAPRVGELICAFTGGMMGAEYEPFNYKCGYVSRVGKYDIVVGVKGTPGNSGAGLLNSRGEIVGLIIQGYMDAYQENWMQGPNFRALAELVPDRLFSPDLSQ